MVVAAGAADGQSEKSLPVRADQVLQLASWAAAFCISPEPSRCATWSPSAAHVIAGGDQPRGHPDAARPPPVAAGRIRRTACRVEGFHDPVTITPGIFSDLVARSPATRQTGSRPASDVPSVRRNAASPAGDRLPFHKPVDHRPSQMPALRPASAGVRSDRTSHGG